MKKKKFKLILISFGLITSLSGCNDVYRHHYATEEEEFSNEKNYEITTEFYDNNYEYTTEYEKTVEIISEEQVTTEATTEIINAVPDKTSEVTIIDATPEEKTDDDKNIKNNIYTFNDEVETLNYFYDQGTYHDAKKYGKELFIRMVDYIFYGTEINGTTFKEATEEEKQNIYENLKVTDKILMSIEPNYKENLSEKYSIVKDFTTEKYDDALDIIKRKIGEEKYNEIKETKDETIDNVQEKTNDIKDKTLKNIKNWYEDFKSN